MRLLKENSIIKKMTGDFVLNFLASAVVTGVMQIILYPLINYCVGSVEYGSFLTIIGLVNTISAVIGTTLNNMRLIHENTYNSKGLKGDFNLLLVFLSVLSFIGVSVVFPFVFDLGILKALCISLLIVLMAVRNYWMVAYRIVIDYKRILFANISLVIGYLLGCLCFFFTNEWIIPFIFGEILCLLYMTKTSSLYKEPFIFTEMKEKMCKDFCVLGLATLSANLLIYLDRLLLYPLMGGEAVTSYTIASLGGKYLGIIATPIASVLLSYYSQADFRMTRKKFWWITGGISFFSFACLIIIVPLAPFLAKLLYPGSYADAVNIMFLANLGGILGVISNFIQPAVLIFAPTKWQIIKEGVYGIIYIGLGTILLNNYGLQGFCVANIIAISSKCLLMIALGNHYCK